MRHLFWVALTVLIPSASIAEVLKWDCLLELKSNLNGISNETMRLIFTVDTLSGRAFMEGNNGFTEVELHIGDSAFSFMEKTGAGAVQTTTITRDGDVVHSRNTVLGQKIVAGQHFGRCQFLEGISR